MTDHKLTETEKDLLWRASQHRSILLTRQEWRVYPALNLAGYLKHVRPRLFDTRESWGTRVTITEAGLNAK